MKLELNQDGLCMKRRQILKVRGGVGHTVVCHSGSVWLTQDGDSRDIILGAGEAFTLDRSGPALVQAFERSAISVAPRGRAARATAAAKPCGHAAARYAHTAVGI